MSFGAKNHITTRRRTAADRPAVCDADAALIAEVRAAVVQGIPVAAVARAAGITRATVYRWAGGA